MRQQKNGNGVAFWLKIVDQEALSNWRKGRVNSSSLQPSILYTDLVNLSIPGNVLCLNRKSQIRNTDFQ